MRLKKRAAVLPFIVSTTFNLIVFDCVAFAKPEVTIIRDSYGVPHVYAERLEGLYYGFGYAVAQDRLFQIDIFRSTFWGRLSEVLGEELLAFDQGNRRDNLTLGEVKLQVERLQPELRIAMRSYAEGINAYIAEAIADPISKLPK